MSQDPLTLASVHDAAERIGRPVLRTVEVARALERSVESVRADLSKLADEGTLERLPGEDDVWLPNELTDLATRERVVVFPERRAIVVDQPEQFTHARLSQFAHLTDVNGDGGYRYVVDEEDVWRAPFETIESLLETVRGTVGRRIDALEGWIEDQFDRARQFRLLTHEDGYTVLEARSAAILASVADQHLDEDHVHGQITETELWVREDATVSLKRTLYEAGYPVQDERDLGSGRDLDMELQLPLRDYQQDWLGRFTDRGAGVLVGPPGSGKTVAAMAIMAHVGGETLVLVPTRELADQWERELLAHTTLEEGQVGQYHGGRKEVRPVTIATYQIAGMDRHRSLFDDREWGLVLFDEVHHVPADVYRRSTHLQSRHRLGLTASAIREDDRQSEIYTLVGPPIGTDWSALFEAGHVRRPTVEIRYLPWGSEEEQNAYGAAERSERYRIAAENSAKVEQTRRLLAAHPGSRAIVFVEYLEQGSTLAAALDRPFLSGETPHRERREQLEAFRSGDLDQLIVSRVGDEGIDLPAAELAVVASGLGGSRRQGTQRAGRTMRPVGGSTVYVLATRGTEEEDFARRRLQHLGRKGIAVRESDAQDVR